MSEFLHMGGYAAFVWSSYAIGLGALIVTIAVSHSAHKKLIRRLRGRFLREQDNQQPEEVE